MRTTVVAFALAVLLGAGCSTIKETAKRGQRNVETYDEPEAVDDAVALDSNESSPAEESTEDEGEIGDEKADDEEAGENQQEDEESGNGGE